MLFQITLTDKATKLWSAYAEYEAGKWKLALKQAQEDPKNDLVKNYISFIVNCKIGRIVAVGVPSGIVNQRLGHEQPEDKEVEQDECRV